MMQRIALLALALPLACGGQAEEELLLDSTGCLIVPYESMFLANDTQIIIFYRKCHGKNRITNNVSLIHADSMPAGPGNVFVSEDTTRALDHPGRVPAVRMGSARETHFELVYSPTARVLFQDPGVNGFTIAFRPDPIMDRDPLSQRP